MHTNDSRSIYNNALSASGKLSVTVPHNNISCYHQVFALDIDFNNTIHNLTTEGKINQTTDSLYGQLSIQLLLLLFFSNNTLDKDLDFIHAGNL